MIRKSFFKYKLALSKDNAILLKVRMIFEKKSFSGNTSLPQMYLVFL